MYKNLFLSLFHIVTEYTDWERTNQHPIITRDSAVSALSDAQYVAPLVHTADLISSMNGMQDGETAAPKCFFSVFDYQTKDGDYPQRMGTVHGEDLPYVFGAPLVDGFSHFPRNYTKSEIALSEAIMIYWSNFVRTGYVQTSFIYKYDSYTLENKYFINNLLFHN